MLMANELAEMRKKVATEANAGRLRRWCIALLVDVDEMHRKISAARPAKSESIAEDSTADRDA
jgi:hypothetical protein